MMAPRGTKPAPSHLKLIRGNPGRRPVNAREPKPALSLPSAPAHLSAEAKAEWARVCVGLHACGILSEIDRAGLAAYCQAYGRWEQAERALAKMGENDITSGLMVKTKNGNAIQNPIVGTANKAMADVVRYAAEFGMTPSSRTRVTAERAAEKDEFFD